MSASLRFTAILVLITLTYLTAIECSDIVPPYWTVTFLLGHKSTLLTWLRISLFGHNQVGMQVFDVQSMHVDPVWHWKYM